LPYNPLTDLAPVGQIALGIAYVVVNPSVPARTMQEFVAYAKANPGKVIYSSPGVGSSSHLMSESLGRLTGIQMLHAPYKGADAITAVLRGEVQMTIFSPAAVEPFVKSGELRMLATTAAQRAAAYPDTPTIAESVAPAFDLVPHFGVLVRAGTPMAIIDKINTGLQTALADPSFEPHLFRFGLLRVPNATPALFGAAIRDDFDKYGKLVRELNLKLE
jgi:tripartite-type tricarboxylate transporter receptor subunit TctC